MTGRRQTLINPAKLPVDPVTCKPVYPHQYLKVNTVFNVAKSHGMRTAWSDKHPAYEILNGSGAGKIAEHGGADPQDHDVPLLVAGAGVAHGLTIRSRVQTTQIAPTILRLLGLDPRALKAVREQGTNALPGLHRRS